MYSKTNSTIMSQENETPKQWAERIAKVFGKRKPAGVRLRGTKSSTFHHEHEIRLVDNFISCRALYTRLGVIYEPKAREHLESQERVIYGLAHSFDIDIEPHLKEKSSSNYDFIPWPDQAESYYTEGLADRIMVTDWHEIRYLLDFQYINHVKGEGFNEVRFLQSLKFLVRHFLRYRVAVVEERRLEFLDEWIYRHVSNLDDDGTKEFFWFKDAFEWKAKSEPATDGSEPKNTGPDCESSSRITHEGGAQPAPSMRRSILQYSCMKEELVEYFNVLKEVNPAKGEVMVNTEAVDWMLGYYFETTGRCTLENMPEFVLNMSKQELMYFIYRFTEDISPRKSGTDVSPKGEVCKILTQCFQDLFDVDADVLGTRLKRETKDLANKATNIIDEAIDKHKARIKLATASKSGRKKRV